MPKTLRLTRLLAPCLLSAAACDPNAYSDENYASADFPNADMVASGGWESAPFPSVADCGDAPAEGEPRWVELGGRKKIEIAHGLGRVPSVVLPYIAFESRGCGGTLASGDVARIDGVDEDFIRVQNATTEHFYLRLYLE